MFATHQLSASQVSVPNMPQVLTTFDLLVQQDLRFPLACLGVYRHHSRRGTVGERYRLHLIDLNVPTTPTGTTCTALPFTDSEVPTRIFRPPSPLPVLASPSGADTAETLPVDVNRCSSSAFLGNFFTGV